MVLIEVINFFGVVFYFVEIGLNIDIVDLVSDIVVIFWVDLVNGVI